MSRDRSGAVVSTVAGTVVSSGAVVSVCCDCVSGISAAVSAGSSEDVSIAA